MYQRIKTRFFYCAAGIYIIIAIFSFNPWIPISNKITAYTSIIALFLTIYDFSKVSYKIAEKKGSKQRRIGQYIFMIVVKFLLITSPLFSLYGLYYLNENIVGKISNYVTFAAIGVVFLTWGVDLKNRPKRLN